MTPEQELADRFETFRGTLHGVAYRMLGSADEADDAVQEAWLRLVCADSDTVENLGGWLRTVVSRICLDMLRSRHSRREDLVGQQFPDGQADSRHDPEREALLAESTGRALLVVLDALGPAERVAFVLHDMFAVPFDEIAPILDRSDVATKKLASRARFKVRGVPAIEGAELRRRRAVVDAFLAASRAGNIGAVIEVLAPDVVRRADLVAIPADRPAVVSGAQAVAGEIVVFGRNARFAELALIDGTVGIVVAPYGQLRTALTFKIEGDQITEYELIADPDRLRTLNLAMLDHDLTAA